MTISAVTLDLILGRLSRRSKSTYFPYFSSPIACLHLVTILRRHAIVLHIFLIVTNFLRFYGS